MNDRNQKLLLEQNRLIEMDPQVMAAFNASSHVSVSKGNSSSLMKASAKRRRSRKEIEESKLEAEGQRAEIARKMARLDELE